MGPTRVAANEGEPVGLYTPATFSIGSSISHVDEQNSALRNLLMSPVTSFGPGEREFGDIERGIFEDLGFSFVVPQLVEGDADGDGKVDAVDLNILALSWQKMVEPSSDADFTGDGLVDAADLNVLALNWQFGVDEPLSVVSFEDAFTTALAAASTANIPEPSSSVLFSSLVVLALLPGSRGKTCPSVIIQRRCCP